MHISQIPQNSYIKISKSSLIIKDEYNKTRGVIKATNFMDLQPNRQIDFSRLLRSVGIWGHPKQLIKYTFIVDNKVYQLRNINLYKYYSDNEKATEDSFYKNIENNGIIVVPFQLLV